MKSTLKIATNNKIASLAEIYEARGNYKTIICTVSPVQFPSFDIRQLNRVNVLQMNIPIGF